ncbi:hypothetical protein GCM10007036_34360 [Alsobacter metallidurans]|uniref:Flagellar protein FlgN n=1 Tax=Alsobacter metallidurans TaxID=340221 RepID=A0A917I903_9HYPH|nr:hypothetical protein [Alsobacter metallidurans]GGH26510.1 hypothetical protein GCM10007036_34360 [Alsobacter metallidurans]
MAFESNATRIASAADAERFAGQMIDVMQTLERIIGEETALLKHSRLREATTLTQAKTDASRHYVHALEALRANAVALARWAPAAVPKLKAVQRSLSDAVQINMAVIATTRSVSESIVRTLAQQVAAPRTLTTYGAAGAAAKPNRPVATPLLVSRSL